MNGGILEIDDQFNIENGGSFIMSGGRMNVHNSGKGSDYDNYNPGSFFIAENAAGSISAGLIKICGKTSSNNLLAVNILSSDFNFTGSGTIEITHGIDALHFDTEIKTASGTTLHDLIINKTGKNVSLISNTVIEGNLLIEAGSTLTIPTGVRIMVTDSVIIKAPGK